MHAKATVDGITIAETDSFEYVEGNVYFPPNSIKDDNVVLTKTSLTSSCPWKGEGCYYDINLKGKILENAAWYYPQPLPKAENIRDHIAFYKAKGVQIEKDDGGEGKGHGLMDKIKHMMKG